MAFTSHLGLLRYAHENPLSPRFCISPRLALPSRNHLRLKPYRFAFRKKGSSVSPLMNSVVCSLTIVCSFPSTCLNLLMFEVPIDSGKTQAQPAPSSHSTHATERAPPRVFIRVDENSTLLPPSDQPKEVVDENSKQFHQPVGSSWPLPGAKGERLPRSNGPHSRHPKEQGGTGPYYANSVSALGDPLKWREKHPWLIVSAFASVGISCLILFMLNPCLCSVFVFVTVPVLFFLITAVFLKIVTSLFLQGL